MDNLEKDKILRIAGLEVKDYYWILGLRWKDQNEVDLHFTNFYRDIAEKLVWMEEDVGIEEYGEREKIETINKRTGDKIIVNVIHLRKLGAIRG